MGLYHILGVISSTRTCAELNCVCVVWLQEMLKEKLRARLSLCMELSAESRGHKLGSVSGPAAFITRPDKIQQ